MNRAILVLNSGSSSIKFAVYDDVDGLVCVRRGKIEAIGSDQARLLANGEGELDSAIVASDHDSALRVLMDWLDNELAGVSLHAAGHRVVHGGVNYHAPLRITDDVLKDLRSLCSLAPLHQPHNLHGIEVLTRIRPRLPQIACFDTAFHRGMPEHAQLFALPHHLSEAGVRRYGFHGLSYEYIAGVLPQYLGDHADGRVIVAHLGHGVSLCALYQRASMATTMSFSPLDGIPMATRSGALDPGAVLYLQQSLAMAADDIAQLLNHQAGLLGVSGISSDMRVLLDSDNPNARLAIDVFIYQTVCAIGSLSAALGGLDALVFTAGIGENAIAVRERICCGCKWLGVEMDAQANNRQSACISTPRSKVSAWVIPTNEELMIARHTLRLVDQGQAS